MEEERTPENFRVTLEELQEGCTQHGWKREFLLQMKARAELHKVPSDSLLIKNIDKWLELLDPLPGRTLVEDSYRWLYGVEE